MILEKNNLPTAKEWTNSYIELIASYVHPKNSNHLRSDLRAIMAPDHRRLIWPGKKIRPNFLRSTRLLYKILQTNLGACKQTFYTIYQSHTRWNSTIYYTDLGQNVVFHNFSRQIASVNIQDDQLQAFSETVQNISKITCTASRFSLLTSVKFAVNRKRVTLQHNK